VEKDDRFKRDNFDILSQVNIDLQTVISDLKGLIWRRYRS